MFSSGSDRREIFSAKGEGRVKPDELTALWALCKWGMLIGGENLQKECNAAPSMQVLAALTERVIRQEL